MNADRIPDGWSYSLKPDEIERDHNADPMLLHTVEHLQRRRDGLVVSIEVKASEHQAILLPQNWRQDNQPLLHYDNPEVHNGMVVTASSLEAVRSAALRWCEENSRQ